jgi:hypothetical protein
LKWRPFASDCIVSHAVGLRSALANTRPRLMTCHVLLGLLAMLELLEHKLSTAPLYQSTGPNTGTLAVTDGASIVNIALLGQYMASSFVTASEGHGGTLITDLPPNHQQLLTQSHA